MSTLDTPASRPTVLVAEDEDNVRLMVAAVLRQRGFDAVLCVDGQDALEQIERADHVDAVLADIRMPRVDGVELARRIRQVPRWSALPIIAMSAYNDEVQEREVRAAGADAFLPKPFTVADLVQVLEELLGTPRSPSQ